MNTRMNLAFVKPSVFSLSGIGFWSWILLLLAVLFTFLSWQHCGSVSKRLHDSNEQLNTLITLQPQAEAKKQTQVDVFKLPKQEVSMISKTVQVLTIPWDGLFETFETTQFKSIALLELSPSQQKEMVIIRGESRDLNAVFSYIRALEQAPVLDKVYLQSHHLDKANPDKPVVFTIHAHWKESR